VTTREGKTMTSHRFTTSRALIAGISAFCVVTGGLALGTGSAFAGVNGQHIELNAHHGDGFGWAQISGNDQNGQPQTSDKIQLDHSGLHHKAWDRAASNQWWKGQVIINWYNWRTGQYVTSSECDVPTNRGSNNWFDCYAPAGNG
jgi:hypothetical protein